MVEITIYTTPTCPFCKRAKALLEQKGAEYTEIDVRDEAVRAEMTERAGKRSVPQIFFGSDHATHIGGCDDLFALEAQGKLDALLAG